MTPRLLLRGGHETADPRLDRVPEFDERSRAFPIAAVVPEKLRSRTWQAPWVGDQGREGACVGFAWTGELAAVPRAFRGASNAYASEVYREAQKVDEWAGEGYSGTSVLAGAKVVAGRGFMGEYRWAFGIDELLRAVAHEGPAVLGIPWLDGMYEAPDGLLTPSGSVVGGHAILARGVRLSGRYGPRQRRRAGEPVVILRNSWGPGYGIGGDAAIKASDLEGLLKQRGECCVPVGRRLP